MESSFKLKVQNAARNLRKEQQKLYNMLNKLEDSSSTFDFFDHDKKKEANGFGYDEEQNEFQEYALEDMNNHQSEELKRIVKGITALTGLLGQMSDVVIEQGSIVDRIDFNIEQASIKVKQGNKQLTQAKEYAESGMAAKCVNFLLAINLCLFVLVFIKYLT